MPQPSPCCSFASSFRIRTMDFVSISHLLITTSAAIWNDDKGILRISSPLFTKHFRYLKWSSAILTYISCKDTAYVRENPPLKSPDKVQDSSILGTFSSLGDLSFAHLCHLLSHLSIRTSLDFASLLSAELCGDTGETHGWLNLDLRLPKVVGNNVTLISPSISSKSF